MAFEEYKRKDSFTRDSAPKVSIRKEHIGFNASFVKVAELQKFSKVKIFVDKGAFRIGFSFNNDDKNPHALTLFSDNPKHTTKAIGAAQIFKDYLFIKKISQFQNPIERQFEVSKDIQDKGLWVAQLCPAFENTASSKSDLNQLKGIYRYKRGNGEIVYIGRGNILSRLNAPSRKDWDFDVIEYSVIENPAEQSEWESYWLNDFAEKEGKLPFYNKLNGKMHS